jgi:isopropylmalate/homocitrate/citramalate synthase
MKQNTSEKAGSGSVRIYDATLRDGTQREGISLSCEDKLRIAERLDAFGVSFIEGGWPGSNPKDAEFFARARDREWKQATIAAFGATAGPQSRRGSSAARASRGVSENFYHLRQGVRRARD